MARGPFNMLRGAFWLLTALVMVELFITLSVAGSCIWVIMFARAEPIGACQELSTHIREIWAEALAAILALLLASREHPDDKP